MNVFFFWFVRKRSPRSQRKPPVVSVNAALCTSVAPWASWPPFWQIPDGKISTKIKIVTFSENLIFEYRLLFYCSSTPTDGLNPSGWIWQFYFHTFANLRFPQLLRCLNESVPFLWFLAFSNVFIRAWFSFSVSGTFLLSWEASLIRFYTWSDWKIWNLASYLTL